MTNENEYFIMNKYIYRVSSKKTSWFLVQKFSLAPAKNKFSVYSKEKSLMIVVQNFQIIWASFSFWTWFETKGSEK